MIELQGLTKRYGRRVALDNLELAVHPGRVTALLGPNGAGKSTTMRILLGLARPTSGSALVDGQEYRDLPAPLTSVGAVLDAGAVHPGRSARAHLAALASSNALPATRVPEVLRLVGLEGVARQRAGTFSLGMRQRLGIAAALLGDPRVVVLDEPFNGLDTEGIRWLRRLLRELAADGRTVLVSSHLISEIELIAEHVVVLGRGRRLLDGSLDDLRRTGDSADVEEAYVRLTAAAVEFGAVA